MWYHIINTGNDHRLNYNIVRITNIAQCQNENLFLFVSAIVTGRQRLRKNLSTVRSVGWSIADACTRMRSSTTRCKCTYAAHCIAYLYSLQHEKPWTISRFPACFQARGKNNTNKQVARRKLYRAK